MPRQKGQTTSRSRWFREYFRADKANLTKTNAEIRTAWEHDNKNEAWSSRHDGTLANVKSAEKKRAKMGGGERGRKKRKVAAAADGAVVVMKAEPKATAAVLETLEYAIDDVLIAARKLEARDEDLPRVVKHLRAARNYVILIQGKG